MNSQVEGPAPPGDRPENQAAAKPLDLDKSSLVEIDSIAAQLRRRREAAKHLPPLSTGKWDPWDLESYYDPARGA
jgi:hypothetical protein